MPDFIGANAPVQEVKIRLGRFTRYYQDNPLHNTHDGEEPNGAGHQAWTGPFYNAHVGAKGSAPTTKEDEEDKYTAGHNDFYHKPWQSLWVPTSEYVTLPNVLEVKTEKKLEIGGISTATVEVENIMWVAQEHEGNAYRERQRGYLSPLRGYHAIGTERDGKLLAPSLPELLDELERIVGSNEWEGVFAYAAQILVLQGFGAATKTFTGLIEDIDSESRPDRITLTCRDFGQLFSETHFFGWGKDPQIPTPVVFADLEEASYPIEQGYDAKASSEASKHEPKLVLDFNFHTAWESADQANAEHTEYVEIALPEGVYTAATLRMLFENQNGYLALRPALLEGARPPQREVQGEPPEDMTAGSKWLDKEGWIDLTKKEEQLVPNSGGSAHGGNSYMALHTYTLGDQTTPLELVAGQRVRFRVGKNSVLRVSLTNLHNIGGGKFRSGVEEFHGLHVVTDAAAESYHWVLVDDIADIVRTLCQWAGFKEWDIAETGVRLPLRIVAYQNESYLDVIKKLCEGIGFTFFMADPTEFGGAHGEGSLGVPTFRKQRLLAADSEEEKVKREEGIERNGVPPPAGSGVELLHRGSTRSALPIPEIRDIDLLQRIKVKQSNEPLSYLIRVYGVTKSQPNNPVAAIAGGQRVVYTFRPPWSGTPPFYHDTRLGGVMKPLVHHDPLFSTVDLARAAAFFIALQQALDSISAEIEIPATLDLDLDDHAQLMDLGTGLTTRVSVLGRSTTFIDGEKRKYVANYTVALLDAKDVRDMVNIINEPSKAVGKGEIWTNPSQGLTVASEDGYG